MKAEAGCSSRAVGAGAPLGSIFGNLLAGIIAEYASWRWVFGAMALLSGSIAVAAVFTIPEPPATDSSHKLGGARAKARETVDWPGAVLVTAGLFALLFALTEGNVVGWGAPQIPVLMLASLVLIAGFVAWQVRLERGGQRAPLMKVSMFASRNLSAAMMIMALCFSSFNGFLVYATYFYQGYQGLGPLQTTLRFLPTGVAGILTSWAVAFALGRVPTWAILLFGTACVTLSNVLFAVPFAADASYWVYGAEAMSLAVFGSDTAWPSLTLFTSHVLPHDEQALGGALVNAMGQVGRAIGLAVATAVQTGVMAAERGVDVQAAGDIRAGDAASLAGLRAASWVDAGLGACAFVVVAVAFRGTGIVGGSDGGGDHPEQQPVPPCQPAGREEEAEEEEESIMTDCEMAARS